MQKTTEVPFAWTFVIVLLWTPAGSVRELEIPTHLYNCLQVMEISSCLQQKPSTCLQFCLQLYMVKSSSDRWPGLNITYRNNYITDLYSAALYETVAGKPKRIRREYRMMTDRQREDYHKAVKMLKADTSVPPNKYDVIALLHDGGTALNAHGGPSFLIWHRLYIAMFETALRQKVPTVTIPYWDFTMDSELEDPRNSILWSPLFAGNGDGHVRNGPFANWKSTFGPLIRNYGVKGELPKRENIDVVLSKSYLEEISFSTSEPESNFEELHGQTHDWVGGLVGELPSAPFDPIFLSIHSYVDYVWYLFVEKQRSNNIAPETDYPFNYGEDIYGPEKGIGIAPMTVAATLMLSILYTDFVYGFEHVPDCSSPPFSCRSPYLTCVKFRCVPVLKDVLMPPIPLPPPIQNSFCIDTVCDTNLWVYLPVEVVYRRSKATPNFNSFPVIDGTVVQARDVYRVPMQMTALSNRVQNTRNAAIIYLEAMGINYNGMHKETAIVDQRLAVTSTIAYTAVRKPTERKTTNVSVFVTDSMNGVCRPYCLIAGSNPPKFSLCTGVIQLGLDDHNLYCLLPNCYEKNTWIVKNRQLSLGFNQLNVFFVFECDRDSTTASQFPHENNLFTPVLNRSRFVSARKT